MFQNCISLEYLNMTNVTANYVEDISYFLEGCGNLTYIDFRSFNTSNILRYENCFRGLPNYGIVIYDPFLFSNEILELFPQSWEKKDINSIMI